uniref:Ovule protein n=1 Tax=Panagrolaimus sp. ES5 TaxID=591445 RepID=A0AC34F1V7_9BILA
MISDKKNKEKSATTNLYKERTTKRLDHEMGVSSTLQETKKYENFDFIKKHGTLILISTRFSSSFTTGFLIISSSIRSPKS